MRTIIVLIASTIAYAESPPDLRTRKTGSDWPIFLGPTSNSVSSEKGILTKWPRDGLNVVWEAPMGLGYAPPVTSRGRFFHFDRFGDDNRLTCRNAENGKLLWKFEYATDYVDLYRYSPGPRACPIVDDDRVYIYGPEGMLHCLSIPENGKVLWKQETAKQYHVHQNFFGVGSVPIIEGDHVIVAVGGSPAGPRPIDLREAKGNGSGIVAFNKLTGKEVYRGTDELASYSSPIIATIGDRRLCLYFSRGGLIAFDPKTGKVDSRFPWRAKVEESVNASNPVVIGDKVLLTECYGPGAALVKLSPGKCEPVWTDDDKDREDKSMQCHWNTPIHVDGYVYGSSGRHENGAQLRCVELATGKVMWQESNLSRASLTLIDGHFLCLTETGQLILVKVNPKKYEPIARWVTDLDNPCWAAPVVSNGIMYIRGKDRLIAAELIPAK